MSQISLRKSLLNEREVAQIPVGTPVTRRPPDRSQRAGLPHWAPALGKDAQAQCGTTALGSCLR